MASPGRSAAVARGGVGLVAGGLVGLVAVDLDLPALVSFHGDRSAFVPLTAATFALLWLSPLRWVAGAAVAVAGALWLAVAFTPLTAWVADGLVRRDERQAGDAIFVFGSSIQMDGDPAPDAVSRLLRGIELVAEGRATRLVVSEIPPPAGRQTPLARAWLERFAGRGEVFTVGPIRNTREEALAVADLCRREGWTTVLAVTSPTHARRAAAALEREGLRVVAIPSIETRFDLEQLDRPGDRREAFGTLVHERVGLLVYRWRGWIR